MAAWYEIVVAGELDPARWSQWFGDLAVTPQPGGTTQLAGPVPDQAALHGLLERVRDLGLVLIAVQRQADPPGAVHDHP